MRKLPNEKPKYQMEFSQRLSSEYVNNLKLQ